MRALLVAAVLVGGSAAGCLRSTEFHCTSSADCSASGAVCEANGFCSFIDTKCAGGRRYGDLSGPVAGQCVGTSMMPDGGVDSNIDGAPGKCPSAYAAIGGSAHRYRVITGQNQWTNQKAACAADGAGIYLAVPDDQAELATLVTGVNMAAFWVGIDDPADNNMFVTVNNATAFSSSSLLWDAGEPDNKTETTGGGNANCVLAKMSSQRLSDDLCNHSLPAICECEP